ncbi:MAG: hypothetical protein ACFFFB_22995, partial [Candidatus Heimdallarchaeota archaeon]
SFRLLDDENKYMDWIYTALKIKTYSAATQAGYIFGIQMDKPNHGYYVGTYEVGEFYFSNEVGLTITRSFPLEYCSRGCITHSKIFLLGLTSLEDKGRHYLVKLNWGTEIFVEWKKYVPAAVMSIFLLDNILYLGLKDGTLQIWDIEKEDCIENIKLFDLSIDYINLTYKNIIVGSSNGEITYLKKNGKVIWRKELSQAMIMGIMEREDAIIIIDEKGNYYRLNVETGDLLLKGILGLKEVKDPSVSSNLVSIRDWFVISGNAVIWVFWNSDYSLVYYHVADDPLKRVLYSNLSDLYMGDDDGCIQLWQFGFKIESFSEEAKKKLEEQPGFYDFELL